MAESYYAARSRRDPAWRRAAIAATGERKRRRRERDPEAFRLAHHEEQRRCYQRQTATGLTFAELHRRAEIHEAFLALGCCLVCFRRLRRSC